MARGIEWFAELARADQQHCFEKGIGLLSQLGPHANAFEEVVVIVICKAMLNFGYGTNSELIERDLAVLGQVAARLLRI